MKRRRNLKPRFCSIRGLFHSCSSFLKLTISNDARPIAIVASICSRRETK